MPQYGIPVNSGNKGGTPTPLLLDKFSALIITEEDALVALSGASGRGVNQAGATLSAALATTYTGLCLSNPAGSGKNLLLQEVGGVFNVAAAALTGIGLITGFAAGGITAHTTPLTVQSGLIGQAVTGFAAKIDAAATLVGTPVWSDWLQELPPATNGINFYKNYKGSIVIPPGGYAAIGSTIAGPAAGLLGAMRWTEVAQ